MQEIHFNDAGFKTREIGFNEGFPDVITSWGWIDGKRVNLQSAVNYPDQGPKSPRRTVVSGYRSFPLGYDIAAFARQYGNRIETDWDQLNRPLVRRRYSSNGSLVYVERFLYKKGSREVTTTDAGGGFMGRTRELLDSGSNVIELQTLAENGQIFSTAQYEYVFDEFQNWITRKAFSKVGAKKGSPRKSVGTTTREISYHSFA